MLGHRAESPLMISARMTVSGSVAYNNRLGVLVHRLIRLELKDLMAERWTLSPPDSFLGQIVHEEFRRRNLAYPKATVTSI